MADTEYLDNERKLLWEEINRIKNDELRPLQEKIKEIAQSIPEDVKEFKSAKHSIDKLKSAFKDYKTQYEEITQKCEEAQKNAETISDTYKNIQDIKNSLEETNKDILQQAEVIKRAIDKNLDLPAKIETVINSMDSWNANYKTANKQAQEIKQKYIEIFGGNDTDEDGNQVEVNGLVDELNNAYNTLQEKMNSLEEKVQSKYNNQISQWNETYTSLKEKVEKLLPSAMSAGLAYAFIEKREREQNEQEASSRTFFGAIIALVVVSLLPVLLNLCLLRETIASNIGETVKILGNLIWAMLPIYIPILWVAIFSNRRINLSKKLIEEYSHKEAIAKTYEGLSNQIQKLDDDDISKELRNKLIENTLQASSENPSKYITNYNKCDNPILELLSNKNLIKIISSDNFDTIWERIGCCLKACKNIEQHNEYQKKSNEQEKEDVEQ